MKDNNLLIIKRTGVKEPFNVNKFNKLISWVCGEEGDELFSQLSLSTFNSLEGVSVLTSKALLEVLIRQLTNLIQGKVELDVSLSRLISYFMRKEAYQSVEVPSLYSLVKKGVKQGYYDKRLLNCDKVFYDYLNDYVIDHNKDNDIVSAGLMQWLHKYLLKNRVEGTLYETPQVAMILIAVLHSDDVQSCEKFYNSLSNNNISLPTPILAGCRSTDREFASCSLVEVGDSLNSWGVTASALLNLVSKKYGIGLSHRCRAKGSEVGGGRVEHTGAIPYLKFLNATINSCNQGGVRKGSGNSFYPFWHKDFHEIVVLKNNKGTDDNRVRELDHSFVLDDLLYDRARQGKDITLFNPKDVQDLLDCIGLDIFREKYEYYENTIPNKYTIKMSAREWFKIALKESFDTGRIYFMNATASNIHSTFTSHLKMSNLCMEVILPTKELDIDSKGEIGVCLLGGVNLKDYDVNSNEFIQHIKTNVERVVVFLDKLCDDMIMSVPQAEYSVKNRRSLSIGVVNYAYWLASQKIRIDEPRALEVTHFLFETLSFYAIRASMKLAKKYGVCPLYEETKFSKGILPIDTYNKNVDELVAPDYYHDWEGLRKDILSYGVRNSTLLALMPTESSSVVSGATNGVEFVRGSHSFKKNNDMNSILFTPDYDILKEYYGHVFSKDFNTHNIKLMAVMQKFVCQSISTNRYYNPLSHKEGMVDLSDIIKDVFLAQKLGLKTLYYSVQYDGEGEYISDLCEGGGCTL